MMTGQHYSGENGGTVTSGVLLVLEGYKDRYFHLKGMETHSYLRSKDGEKQLLPSYKDKGEKGRSYLTCLISVVLSHLLPFLLI